MNHPLHSFFAYAGISLVAFACGSPGSSEPTSTPASAPALAMNEPVQTPVTQEPVATNTEPAQVVAVDLLAVEMATYQAAKPVFEENCGVCHTPKPGKKVSEGAEHFAMGSYPFQGHHAADLGSTIRSALGAAGKPATMPKDDPGSLGEDDLILVLAWADAFDAAAAAKLGYHGEASDDHHHHHAAHEHADKDAAPKPKHEHAGKKAAEEPETGHKHHDH